jgi:protein TonB
MFDYVSTKPTRETDKPRYMTATVSAAVHVVVLFAAVGLPILYASEELPTPPDMMAFVMEAPLPPPPPPPPPPPVEKTQPAKSNQPAVATPQTIARANPVAAPVEAPRAIMPESGLEAANGAARIEAGFEGGIEGGVVGGAVGGIATGAPPPPPPPAPKAVPQGPVRVGGQIKAPQLVNRVNPAYPAVAQSAQVEGSVILEATVGKDGRVQTVRVVRGHPLLEQAAITAVKQWRYEPLALNGEPVPFVLTVTLNFTIPR